MDTHLVYPSLHLSPLRSFPFSSLSLASTPPHSRFAGAGRGLRLRRRPIMAAVLPESALLHDVGVSALASGVALGLLRFWEELAKRGVFEQVKKRF